MRTGAGWHVGWQHRIVQSARRPILPYPSHRPYTPSQLSSFLSTTATRKRENGRVKQNAPGQVQVEKQESIKPESVDKPAKSHGPGKKNELLAEATVSNKEQRKADWAIMKEMVKYLWPKVFPAIPTLYF